MIIVSQDRKSIYNFDNVKSIDILGNEIYIADDILADEGACIAEYATETRAKEVLQEIQVAYSDFKYFEVMKKEETAQRIIERYATCNVYKMPEK